MPAWRRVSLCRDPTPRDAFWGTPRTLAEKLFLRGPSGGAASASRVGSPPAPVAASADLTPAMQNRGTDPE